MNWLNFSSGFDGACEKNEPIFCPKFQSRWFQFQNSDVLGEQKSGSGRVRGLLFGVGSGSGINISGTSPSGFRGFGDF